MKGLDRTNALRLSLWALSAVALVVAVVEPALAGTAAAPEIQDPANDQKLSPAGQAVTSLGPACAATCLSRIDILSAWIDHETPAGFNVNVALSSAPLAAVEYNSNYEFHATFGGTEVVSTVSTDGTGPVAGDNVQAVAADGNTLIITIAKSVYGPTALVGGQLTAIFVTGVANLGANGMDLGVELASDRAPDADGVTYNLAGSGGGNPPNDTDGDGLNDTCETKYFGNTTAQNATGDGDHDGLTNGQECALGTDPTKADSDGDGCNDKADSAPTDATKGCASSSSSSSSSGSGSRSGSSSGSGSGSSSGSHSSTGSSGGGGANGSKTKGAPKDFNEALDRLQSDPGYVGLSSGGFLAVLVLCIIGLAVRWSL